MSNHNNQAGWSDLNEHFNKLNISNVDGLHVSNNVGLNNSSMHSIPMDSSKNAPPGIPFPNLTGAFDKSLMRKKMSSGSYDSKVAMSNSFSNLRDQPSLHSRQNSLPTNLVMENAPADRSNLVPQSPIGTRTMSSNSSTCSPSPTLSDTLNSNINGLEPTSFSLRTTSFGSTTNGLPPKPRTRSSSLANSSARTGSSQNLSSSLSTDLVPGAGRLDRIRSYSADTLLQQHANALHRRSGSDTLSLNNSTAANANKSSLMTQLAPSANINSRSMPDLNNKYPKVDQTSVLQHSSSAQIMNENNSARYSTNDNSQQQVGRYSTSDNSHQQVGRQMRGQNVSTVGKSHLPYGNPYDAVTQAQMYATMNVMYPMNMPGYIHYQQPPEPFQQHGAQGQISQSPYHVGNPNRMYIQSNPGVIASEAELIRASKHGLAVPPPSAPQVASQVSPGISSILMANGQQQLVFQVKFKRLTKSYLLSSTIPNSGIVKVGTYVIVQADRGEDLGLVIARTPLDRFKSKENELKYVLRCATPNEVRFIEEKFQEESVLLKICRSKVKQRKLNMSIIDAEYQFDRHKLTFYFEAEGRVDFRELVRDLFSVYKTRIWMQQVDKGSEV